MNALREECQRLRDELIALRREFHRDPPLARERRKFLAHLLHRRFSVKTARFFFLFDGKRLFFGLIFKFFRKQFFVFCFF